MPEVGIYDSPEVNAFATGPSKRSSLVAVSTGLMQRLSRDEMEAVLGHEITHVANGDMVTMTLIQGVVNAFVMFFARIAATLVGSQVESRNRWLVEMATYIVLQIALGLLGSMVVCWFSRQREFRADAGGGRLAGRQKMIAALQALGHTRELVAPADAGVASLKIAGRSGMMRLFMTHPPLEERIEALRQAAA
jgi:heat shock protein HtpX